MTIVSIGQEGMRWNYYYYEHFSYLSSIMFTDIASYMSEGDGLIYLKSVSENNRKKEVSFLIKYEDILSFRFGL